MAIEDLSDAKNNDGIFYGGNNVNNWLQPSGAYVFVRNSAILDT
jgi:hypothetical protein